MVICRKDGCDTNLPDDANFCLTCGTPVKDPLPKQNETAHCPKRKNDGQVCGNLIRNSDKFCMNCGWKIKSLIFQWGSKPCSEKGSNGEFCDGVIAPDSLQCTCCNSTTKQIKGTCLQS